VCYEALGKRAQAIEEYETALRLAPSNESIRANLEAARKRDKAADKSEAGGPS
jgi:Flp pilus assembly protein TadD